MSKTYNTPGVYINEIPTSIPSIIPAETAIPAFIGYTEKATRNTIGDLNLRPTLISSLAEYEELFGTAKPEINFKIEIVDEHIGSSFNRRIFVEKNPVTEPFLLHYMLQLFFANGGENCYIVSVGQYSHGLPQSVDEIENTDQLQRGLDAIKTVDDITLLLFPDLTRVSNINPADYYDLYNQSLAHCAEKINQFTIIDTLGYDDGSLHDRPIQLLRTHISSNTSHTQFGACYYPYLKTIIPYLIDERKTKVTHHRITKHGKEIGLYHKLPVKKLKSLDRTVYHQIKNKLNEIKLELPPSAALAGKYCYIDKIKGVWKAPANLGLLHVVKPSSEISFSNLSHLNVDPDTGKSVNAIKHFGGRGTLVWGARTLAGNDNEWRYVGVRRFASMVEESCSDTLEYFLSEPNDMSTWSTIKAMIRNFLTNQWRAGALAGATTKQAFFVNVGLGETMTQNDIDNGKLIIEIGMAVVRPAEFLILRIEKQMQ